MKRYDNGGRPGCADPDSMFKIIGLMTVVFFKMVTGRLPKTW